MNIELLSIDLSNYCSKQCAFCYNHSTKEGNTMWKPEEVIRFASDCVAHGVRAVSLGGGEPFEYDGIFDVIDALYPLCYLSVTSNGLPLEEPVIWNRLLEHAPDKIHLTIHQPDNQKEVQRVIHRILELQKTAIKPGVNLLISKDKLVSAKEVYNGLMKYLSADQVILVPQRFNNTPTPKEIGMVTNGKPFQCPSCLLSCKKPVSFCSVSWDKKVNFCSFAGGKESLMTLDYDGSVSALNKVAFVTCNG